MCISYRLTAVNNVCWETSFFFFLGGLTWCPNNLLLFEIHWVINSFFYCCRDFFCQLDDKNFVIILTRKRFRLLSYPLFILEVLEHCTFSKETWVWERKHSGIQGRTLVPRIHLQGGKWDLLLSYFEVFCAALGAWLLLTQAVRTCLCPLNPGMPTSSNYSSLLSFFLFRFQNISYC